MKLHTAILILLSLLSLIITGTDTVSIIGTDNTKIVDVIKEDTGRAYLNNGKPQNYYDLYEKRQSLRDQLKTAGATSFLINIDKVGLGYLLDGKGYYTIFAPTNKAFDRLGNDQACKFTRYNERYKAGKNVKPSYSSNFYPPQRQYTKSLEATIEHQIILGNYHFKDLSASNGALIPSINGVPVAVYSHRENVVVNGGSIIRGDFHASNGVVHIVDYIHCLNLESIAQILSQSYDETYDKFMDVLSMVNLLPLIYAGPPVTVLVPSRSDLEAFLYDIRNNEEQYFIGSVSKIIEFAQSRILSGFCYPENLRHLPYVKSLFGPRLSVTHKSANEVFIGGHPVSLTSMKLSTNGILYLPNGSQYSVGRNYGGGRYGGYPAQYRGSGGGGGYGGGGYYTQYRPTAVSNQITSCGLLCNFAIL